MDAALDDARYISFGSRRRDGTLVATPTWVVAFDGGYAFTTSPTTHKVARIRRDPSVVVAPCDVRGRVRDDAVRLDATARVLDDGAVAEVQRLVRAKYPVGWLLTVAPRRALDRLRGRPRIGDCAIGITLER